MTQNNKLLADYFTGLYSVSKTLRFELRPMGKTLGYIEANGILDTDFQRADSYKKVKKIIDRYHKQFIDEALFGLQLEGLDEYYQLYTIKRDDKNEKKFENLQTSLRKQIVKRFAMHPKYKNLFKKELIQEDLYSFVSGNAEEEKLVKDFKDFTTYFSGFHENRKNMYTDENKASAIAYRIIHQNLPKFIDNMYVFSLIKNCEVGDKLDELLENLRTKISLEDISVYFEIQGFNQVMTQQGIDTYNTILGAFSTEDNRKIKGLNEYINLYNQQNKQRIPKMKPLFKQILSDREKVSFIPEQFGTDKEVLDAVEEFYATLRQNIFENEEQINIDKLISNISGYNLNKIFIKNDSSITDISNYLYDNWSCISNAINEDYDRNSTDKKKNTIKYAEKKQKEIAKRKNLSIGELNCLVREYTGETRFVEEYFVIKGTESLVKIKNAYESCDVLHNRQRDNKNTLCKKGDDVGQLKELLDSIKELQWILKPLIGGQEEPNKDELFYVELLRIWEELDAITLLYNKVRNYITQKPYSLEKVKLNFNKSTLLSGWSINKEPDNLGIILIKDGLFYLGIMNDKHNKIMHDAPEANTSCVYQKMEYMQLNSPYMQIPRNFIQAKTNRNKSNLTEELLNNYNNSRHIKGSENFDLNACHALIDYFKQSLDKHEDWSQFDFHFSDTNTYEDISGFYKEVEHQGYKLTFKDIDCDYIDGLVEQGKLYLFQVYNKDFSPHSKGAPNLHTLYWKMLFAQENLRDVVYKLNGQAEVFYRRASIQEKDIVRHKANKPIINKDPQNEKRESVFEYDLIKDKRFTCDKFQFHVPITMNFQAEGENHINRKVNCLIHGAEDLYVIGIDRGERNLLYLSVIDMQGKIKLQMSLNEIISYDRMGKEHKRDYHQLLTEREKENKNARQNWQTINTIKELKEGYLSQAIHVITDLMIQYNAIVVLEDLNMGFMRGRQKFERQVYQKFERMLIEKLNYLVDKNKGATENGGLLYAYQLTDEFKSFQRLGKQTGFLYYVPAWNTSKLDPATGFVNLFYTKYESIEKTREFIKKFDSISYNVSKGYFEFAFDYSNFTYKAEGSRLDWVVCSAGNRIENYRNPEQDNMWDTRSIDLTKSFQDLFEKYGISLSDGDLRTRIIHIEEAEFYKAFMKNFSLMLQMRNSDAKTNEDRLISPVQNAQGQFFETGLSSSTPLDADANGAYNIARKGLWIIEQIKNTSVDEMDKIKLAISNKEWLKYAQEHTL